MQSIEGHNAMYQGYALSQERRGDENSSFVGTVRQHIYQDTAMRGVTGVEAASQQGRGK